MSVTHGISNRSPIYQRPFLCCQPFMVLAATRLQNSSCKYPAFILAIIDASEVICSTALTPDSADGGIISSGNELGGRRERASATVLSSPRIYVIVISYCDRNSCHCNCRRDKSFCVSKFSSVR